MGQKSKIPHQPNKVIHVLAIETSCDDTSCAIVSSHGEVVSLESQNQDQVHSPYGGIIPELACRNHTVHLLPLLETVFKNAGLTWEQIDGICVTHKPGLLGSLLVGVTVAKTLSAINKKPLIGVNHLEGHLYAPFLKDAQFDLQSNWEEPFLGLCVSGGHTSLVQVTKFGKYKTLGRTLDDAAGEAFDKFGKVLGLGYPAGKKMDELSQSGDPRAFKFPRPLLKDKELNFSFSGLKTAGLLKYKELTSGGVELSPQVLKDLCASYQEAISDVLFNKLIKAQKKTGIQKTVLTGGVAANSRIRKKLAEIGCLFAPAKYCTDNAAMIGFVGAKKLLLTQPSQHLKLQVEATLKNAEITS